MSETKTADKLNEIIHEHLMSMDFDAHSDKCTPTERALFFRMKDVAFAFTAFKTQELQMKVDGYNKNIDKYIDALDDLKIKYTQLKDAADEMYNCFASGNLEKIEKALITYKQLKK